MIVFGRIIFVETKRCKTRFKDRVAAVVEEKETEAIRVKAKTE